MTQLSRAFEIIKYIKYDATQFTSYNLLSLVAQITKIIFDTWRKLRELCIVMVIFGVNYNKHPV